MSFWLFTSLFACTQPHLYFDLGNTLVDTRVEGVMKYMPDAEAYVRDLKTRGYHLGLIVNIPASWGASFPERLARLKSEVANGWLPAGSEFAWDAFDQVILPENDAQRKPAPALFLEAGRLSGECPVIYQGEDTREIDGAKRAGLKGSLVPHSTESFYLPESEFSSKISRR